MSSDQRRFRAISSKVSMIVLFGVFAWEPGFTQKAGARVDYWHSVSSYMTEAPVSNCVDGDVYTERVAKQGQPKTRLTYPSAEHVYLMNRDEERRTYTAIRLGFTAVNDGDPVLDFEIVAYDGTDGAPGEMIATIPAQVKGIPAFPEFGCFEFDVSTLPIVVDQPIFLGVRWIPKNADDWLSLDLSAKLPFHTDVARPERIGGWSTFQSLLPLAHHRALVFSAKFAHGETGLVSDDEVATRSRSVIECDRPAERQLATGSGAGSLLSEERFLLAPGRAATIRGYVDAREIEMQTASLCTATLTAGEPFRVGNLVRSEVRAKLTFGCPSGRWVDGTLYQVQILCQRCGPFPDDCCGPQVERDAGSIWVPPGALTQTLVLETPCPSMNGCPLGVLDWDWYSTAMWRGSGTAIVSPFAGALCPPMGSCPPQ